MPTVIELLTFNHEFMTRKILKFFAIGILFMIVFLACRADNEEISNPKDENSEFVSKSLWKEDEIYIKNVMKIYNTHEREIQKKSAIRIGIML